MLTQTNFSGIGVPTCGKVRDIYDLNPYLLIVATDRISAFDVAMEEGIPYKGQTLTAISELWFKKLSSIVPNHLVSCNTARYPEVCRPYAEALKGRSMLVKKATPLKVECVVRGYLAGSGWKEYQETQSICGIHLRHGMVESERLDQPIFTPSTKAAQGSHDENIPLERAEKILGHTIARIVREKSLELYIEAQKFAEQAGIIIADTKFEFGFDSEGNLILIDEALTPDSSRFWPVDKYIPGRSQESYDKQFLRDYLERIRWNKQPPPPTLPPDIVNNTASRYLEAYNRLKKVLAD